VQSAFREDVDMDGSRATGSADYGAEEAAMQAYIREGEKRAAALGNRGPIRFTDRGDLHPDIVDAYWPAASTSSRAC
jgi:hypothetical protein